MHRKWYRRVENLFTGRLARKRRLTQYKMKQFDMVSSQEPTKYFHMFIAQRLHYYLIKMRHLLQKLLGFLKLNALDLFFSNNKKPTNRLYLSQISTSIEFKLATIAQSTFLVKTLGKARDDVYLGDLLVNKKKDTSSKMVKQVIPADIIELNDKYIQKLILLPKIQARFLMTLLMYKRSITKSIIQQILPVNMHSIKLQFIQNSTRKYKFTTLMMYNQLNQQLYRSNNRRLQKIVVNNRMLIRKRLKKRRLYARKFKKLHKT